jgi:hypothetical protein
MPRTSKLSMLSSFKTGSVICSRSLTTATSSGKAMTISMHQKQPLIDRKNEFDLLPFVSKC